jgi:N-acetylglucosaminyldiphosphoundecaprenol N-acetyl-beta-D-mannosaminyltransferase
VDVLGVHVDPLDLKEVLQTVDRFVRTGERHSVHYANVYCVNLAQRDEEYKAILNRADLVYCDGYGVVLGARIVGAEIPGRMTGADWIHDLSAVCQERGYSIYLLGSKPDVSRKAADRLTELYPSLKIAGNHHGYLTDEKTVDGAIRDINSSGPDIVLVGMGSPIQEKFIDKYRREIEAPVCWSVGALFDFVSEIVPRAPDWMLNNGLEWLFRLLYEPGRMWNRYLVGNTSFLLKIIGVRLKRLFN